MAKYKGKKLTELKGDARAARIKELLGNPGTRKLVPTADLPAQLKAKRDLNARLNAPIVPGSATTQRDLSHSREAAVTTQFGPNAVGALQKREGETAGWFDEYQRRLAEHRANVQGFGEQAAAQTANLGNVQGAAGSTPQDAGVQATAAQADAVRKSLLGAMQGQQAGQSRAATTYADTLANVVAPGQKIQALGTARANTDALKAKQGAFRTQFEGEARQSEGKNVLAQQALGLNTQKAQVDAATKKAQTQIAAARVNETGRHNQAVENAPPSPSERKTQQQIDYFNKHGYYPKTGPGAKAKPKKGEEGAGPEWLTNAQMGAGLTQVVKLKDFANKAKTGQPFVPGHQPQGAVSRSEAAKKIYANAPSLKDPALLSAALDAAYDGHLSPVTVKKLIDAGYKPKRVAQALGVPTAGESKAKGTAAKPKIPPLNIKKLKKT